MRNRDRIKTALLAVALVLVFTEVVFGWPWNTDMYWHQSIRTFEQQPLAPPEGALYLDAEPPMDRVTARDALVNPVSPTPESLARGKDLYMNMCVSCHGDKGAGDGPISTKFVTPANLKLPMYVKMTDGYIYGTIRNGAINMPPQGTALSPDDRWHVVNYVRSLQKQ